MVLIEIIFSFYMKFESTDIFECVHLDITDELLANAKIIMYMNDQEKTAENGEKKPYTQKNFPEKAIDIVFTVDDTPIEIFYRSDDCDWDSYFVVDNQVGKVSFDQFGQFFMTKFYEKLIKYIETKWPLSDPTYMRMFEGLSNKKVRVGFSEDELSLIKLDEVDQAEKRVDLANKDITGDGKRGYTGSGRKIITFGDQGVKANSVKCYCWPNHDPKMTFKWSQWKDWTKLKPFAKMKFTYNSREYMITLSLFDEGFEDRGFRGADLTWTPPLAWLTPEECEQIMRLTITRKFIKGCIARIKKYLSYSPSEIYDKINDKDKITTKEIQKTQRVIKHVLDSALRKQQADTYCWK